MRSLLFWIFIFSCSTFYGQAGISATPVKFYYHLAPGAEGTQSLFVSNPTNVEIEVGVSFKDWNYGKKGNNQIFDSGALKTSAANWIKVMPSSYFVLQPGERKKLDLVLNVPQDANHEIPVHTALIFLTQLNPGDGGTDKNGAAIKVSVRMGVKIYHSFTENAQPAIEIIGFDLKETDIETKSVVLTLENQGTIWTDGTVSWELFNSNTGVKTRLKPADFYTLPNDKRWVTIQLPENLKTGSYTLTAVVNYEDSNIIKVAELAFEIKQE